MTNFIKRMSPAARLATGVGGAAAVAVLAAACSSGSSTTGAAPTGSSPAAGASSPSGSGSTVIKTGTSSAGTLLTDGSGRAVYLWTKDSGGTSACTGACTGTWPPVMASGMVTASGGAKSVDLGMITRSDGTKQVTYNGHPLYYYAGDSGTGTASGQGSNSFGARWWLVSPGGSGVTASVSSFTVSSGGSAPATHTAPATPAPSSSHSAGGGWG
jgi:predicted lipoprotein with Yx(FWY)xxD motif